MRPNNSVKSRRFGRFFRIKKLILTAWIILSIFLLSILISCSHKNAASGAANTNGYLYRMFNSFDPRSLLQNLGNNIIPPLFVNLEASRLSLVAATDSVCSSDTLASAQAAWIAHVSDLKKVEPFRFGTTLSSFSKMDPFLIDYLTEAPPSSGDLDDLDGFDPSGDFLDAQTYIAGFDNDAKGIGAIEYLLFSQAGVNRGTAPSCSDFANAPNGRSALLRALVVNYSGHVQNVTNAWDVSGTNPLGTQLATAGNGSSTTFPSSDAALDAVFAGVVQLLTIMKDGKLEIPAGLSGGGNGSVPKTDRAEFRFSGQSFQSLINNFSTFKAIYTGNGTGAGLSDYVKFYSPALDEEIKGEIAELEVHLGDITPSLSPSDPSTAWGSSNAANFTAIQACIEELGELLTILNTELAALTGSNPVSGGPGGDGD
ncbi:imelysin family protein [Leptospira licerasiae]|uniref:Imelysin n=1 Tax=Leptospira licerasiae str. MMD4847 TaxID=1049971 RepID=A0ABN0HA91_9LEPT|nr:imelysin family protein [Leptospira licerasiae]EIE00757.1 imelysin [Leptospira licerasiae serovar Varillal str. VAR 010]EJZ42511.1 imelysin [Leptospira licerasiae str. MMD4847]